VRNCGQTLKLFLNFAIRTSEFNVSTIDGPEHNELGSTSAVQMHESDSEPDMASESGPDVAFESKTNRSSTPALTDDLYMKNYTAPEDEIVQYSDLLKTHNSGQSTEALREQSPVETSYVQTSTPMTSQPLNSPYVTPASSSTNQPIAANSSSSSVRQRPKRTIWP